MPRESASLRWVLKEGDLKGDHDYIVGPAFEDGVEVMPVSEHERLLDAARAVLRCHDAFAELAQDKGIPDALIHERAAWDVLRALLGPADGPEVAMSKNRYPILVDGYRGKQGVTIVCEVCAAEALITEDDLNQDGVFDCPADPSCGWTAIFKYAEADRCPNCRKLGFWDRVLNHCCSRPCMLQWEYAQNLAASRGQDRS